MPSGRRSSKVRPHPSNNKQLSAKNLKRRMTGLPLPIRNGYVGNSKLITSKITVQSAPTTINVNKMGGRKTYKKKSQKKTKETKGTKGKGRK
jgi:hypothetical protein